MLWHSTTYYPQENGSIESSNKTLVIILKKTIAQNQRSWDSQLKILLCDNRVTTKNSTGKSPFDLVYGATRIFPTQLDIPMEKFIQDEKEETNPLTRRINELVELQDNIEKATENLIKYQDKMMNMFDKNSRNKIFWPSDLVLRWDVKR